MVEDMAYTQLNIEEREALPQMRWEGRSIRYMARVLGRSPSTISRELLPTLPALGSARQPRLLAGLGRLWFASALFAKVSSSAVV